MSRINSNNVSGAGGDHSDNLIAIAVFGMIVLVGLYYFGEKPFVELALYSVKAKLELLELLGLLPRDDLLLLAKVNARLDTGSLDGLTWGTGAWLLNGHFRIEAIAFAFLLFFQAFMLFIMRPASRYIRRLDMKKLLFQKARVHPEMRPVFGLGDYLSKRKSFFTGSWRLADTPVQFAFRNMLLYEVKEREEKNDKGESITVEYKEYKAPGKNEARFYDPENLNKLADEAGENWLMDKRKAKEVFEKQLGECMIENGKFMYRRIMGWPRHHKALLAAFILLRYADRKYGLKLFEQFSSSPKWWNGQEMIKKDPDLSHKDLDTKWVNEILENYIFGKPLPDDCPYPPVSDDRDRSRIRKELAKHAFSNVILFHFLNEVARSRGIVITADFIWLRPMDRTLFYALNSSGRNNPKNGTSFPEGAGVMAHYMVEESLGEAIPKPDVRDAVIGLEDALYKSNWVMTSQRNREQEIAKRRKEMLSASAKGEKSSAMAGAMVGAMIGRNRRG